jgi:hypothetical protein
MRHKKTAQITFRVDSDAKDAAEKAAAADQCSLTSLIEKLLTKYLQKRGLLSRPRLPAKLAARQASKLATREVDSIDDKSLPAERRGSRKRLLIRGPKEFRDMGSDLPQATRKKLEDGEQKL